MSPSSARMNRADVPGLINPCTSRMKSPSILTLSARTAAHTRQGRSERRAGQRHPDHQPREETREAEAQVEHNARAQAPIDRVRPVGVPDDHRDALEEEVRLVPAEPDDLIPDLSGPLRSSYPMAHRWPVVSTGSLLISTRPPPWSPAPFPTERVARTRLGHEPDGRVGPSGSSPGERLQWGGDTSSDRRDDLESAHGAPTQGRCHDDSGRDFAGIGGVRSRPSPIPALRYEPGSSAGARSRRGAARRHLETQTRPPMW